MYCHSPGFSTLVLSFLKPVCCLIVLFYFLLVQAKCKKENSQLPAVTCDPTTGDNDDSIEVCADIYVATSLKELQN